MKSCFSRPILQAALASVLGLVIAEARADVVTDWNSRACEVLADAKLGTPPAIRAMALVQTAVHEAVSASRGASADAAIAAANRGVLAKLVPAQMAAIDAAYRGALALVPEGPAKSAGIAAGEQAAAAVLARRADDRPAATEEYRPQAFAGVYVPTASPAAPQWVTRTPWLMASAGQFRPEPPPTLTSEAWARDYNEVKSLGGRASSARSAEQTDIAKFWEYSLPPIYYGVVRSVADMPGRDVAANARLFMAVAQAMDDAMISVFEAKYHYHFWRPVTAIRNGDTDGNDATQREAGWLPLVDAPMHPEYPSGHAILAGSVGAVLEAALGTNPAPLLTTRSPSAKGAMRSWPSPAAFVQEVGASRIYAGIHYRAAVENGAAMGQGIGRLAAERHLAPATRVAASDCPSIDERGAFPCKP